MPWYGIYEVNLIPFLGQPATIDTGAATHVEDDGRRWRQISL
jgi:hypothetical protein